MLNALKQNPKVKAVYKNSYNVLKLFVRLLRKRIVLAIIFTLSFTYCLVSLVRQKSTSKSISGNVEDYEANVDIEHLQHIIRQSHRLDHHFLEDDRNHNQSVTRELSPIELSDDNQLKSQLTNDRSLTADSKCRNSIQGKVLIADDRGFVCHRKDVLLSGCCDPNSINTKLYSCETCQSHGCCAIYEFCISCCLEPSKKPLLTKIVGQKTSETFSILMASITDHFELCLTKCRTSSASVQHENSYRDPKAKHCYGENTEKVN